MASYGVMWSLTRSLFVFYSYTIKLMTNIATVVSLYFPSGMSKCIRASYNHLNTCRCQTLRHYKHSSVKAKVIDIAQ